MDEDTQKRMWMVRAGRGGILAQDFFSANCVAFADEQIANLCSIESKKKMEEHVRNKLPDLSASQARMLIGQSVRFALEMDVGDRVVTYDPDRRVYMIGTIEGGCKYEPNRVEVLVHTRQVKWQGSASRDGLTASARNSLGGIASIFSINEDVEKELLGLMQGKVPVAPDSTADEESGRIDSLRLDSEESGRGFIEDKVVSLAWDQMQDLVAGILRAMGFKTRISQPGPDQGRDIMASPDGLGLSHPRIIVEVKHRLKQQVDAQMIRSFLGGRRPGDNAMYVSTGGFTKDARYEAERSNIPLALITLEELVDLLLQHYPNADAETRALVPVVPVYWPA